MAKTAIISVDGHVKASRREYREYLPSAYLERYDAEVRAAEEMEAPDAGNLHPDLPPDVLPASECLKDVVERMLPWWFDAIVPDLRAGATVLVAAHGNSLRALIKHLDGISDDDIVELNLPTGVPIRYELGDDFRPLSDMDVLDRVVGDVEAARSAAAAVSNQASASDSSK